MHDEEIPGSLRVVGYVSLTRTSYNVESRLRWVGMIEPRNRPKYYSPIRRLLVTEKAPCTP